MRRADPLRLLGAAYHGVQVDLAGMWEDRRLVDDLPNAVADKAASIGDDFRRQAREMLEQEQTSYFDTHPADSARIRSAQALDAPGIFTLEAPATALFDDFEALAKRSTRRFYLSELGISTSGSTTDPGAVYILPIAEEGDHDAEDEAFSIIEGDEDFENKAYGTTLNSRAGDFDGDGAVDLIVGDYQYGTLTNAQKGSVFVTFGG